MPVIEILVRLTGETIVQTKGYAGTDCRSASKFLELALGRRQSEKLTPEFYQTNPQEQQLEQYP